jgi:Domain of unknown function (DUF4838)
VSTAPDLARLAAGTIHLPAEADAPVVLAAEELARYLARMFGREPAQQSVRGAPRTWICLAPAGGMPADASLPVDHEYAVAPAGDALVLTAASPRALLAAAYALLAGAGCRWSPFGTAEEHVPDAGEARRHVPALVSRPAFARRAYAADLSTWHMTMPERRADRLPRDAAFVDWMAKSGATGFQFIRHANDADWIVPEVVSELGRRGLEVEGGGHALVELLPRALFATHPDYFPLASDGQRSDLGNACASSRDALAVVTERARTAYADLPGAAGFHLWGLDLLGGGWCVCTGCARLAASDQALRVCNAAADGLDGRIFHLAYHDTLEAPRTVRPHPRVWAEFAPRERCYAHALDEPSCATNGRYRSALEAHLEWFDGRVEAFEYYGDAILFGGCAVPLTSVVARDLAYYARVGVHGVSCLTFGRYSLWAYGVNHEAFARGVLDPAAAEGAAGTYCARYGRSAAPMQRYLALLERAMAAVVTDGDVLLPPVDRNRDALGSLLAEAPALRALLAEAAREVDASERVTAEGRFLDYTLGALGALDGWLGAGDDATAMRALEELSHAPRAFQGLGTDVTGTWGAHDLEITHHFFAAALRARRG